MQGDYSGKPTQVTVNQRALVDKVLARYPEEFTVFRELVQNADDARAKNVEIEFQTGDYIPKPPEDKTTNGTNFDLTNVKVSKWVVRNDGDELQEQDWDRLTRIAAGNPDEQKIGAFGVGFFSVFSITESPVVISGDRCIKMYYDGDQLMVQPGGCEATKWTVIEMAVKDEQLPMPNPFGLSRFLCTAVTFLVNIKTVTLLFNGNLLSEITKSRGTEVEIKDLPKDLKRKRNSGFMRVDSVKMIPQEVKVTLTNLACSAGSKRLRANKTIAEKGNINPAQRSGFFDKLLGKPEPNGARSIPHSSPRSAVSVAQYMFYSARISSTPSTGIVSGLKAATKKNPPSNFPYEAVHFTMDQYQRVMQDGNKDENIGSVFRGSQGLCSEEAEGHGSRLFIGQSTAETSGIAVHLSSRFIPTVERGSIDLNNSQVAKWNEELLYVGGFLTRLIYERAMKDIRNRWPESPSPLKDHLREEAMYTMACFTLRQSTPDPKVGRLLQDAFFNCSASQSFPILSNLGIRDSVDVRQPCPTFERFMKERPVLDSKLWPIESTIVEQLPEKYTVKAHTFGDVKEEFDRRIFTEEDMVECVGWWVDTFGTPTHQTIATDQVAVRRDEVLSVAKFRSSKPPHQVIMLSTIKKFVDRRPVYSFIRNDDPLPPDTIPLPFTRTLDADKVRAALGWEHLTIVDWIEYLVNPKSDLSQEIRKNSAFSEKVLTALRTSWPSIKSSDRNTVVALMRSVECIPTNRGHYKPEDAYFPEADLFDELPVVQLPSQLDSVLDSLGVRRYLDWDKVENRLDFRDHSMIRLVPYLQAVRPHMGDKFRVVAQLRIFASETGSRHCIRELYHPHPTHRILGLPVLRWNDEPALGQFGPTFDAALSDFLHDVGLQRYPPLKLIIEKASSKDVTVRQSAYDFFVLNLESYYDKYNPADFPEFAFLPCGKESKPTQFGTPEEVFTSSEWEVFGFRTIHKSVPPKLQARLKVKERPSGAAIIKAMKQNPPPNRATAEKWFKLVGRGGFSADELAEVSNLKIVPVQFAPLTASPDGKNPDPVAPKKCFYERPDPAKVHHYVLFTYVDYGQTAKRFLKMCGAKPNPDCSDIVEAMMANPQRYLDQIELYLEKHGDKAQAYNRYLDDLRQVAAGYHSLSTDLRAQIKKAPIFLSFRKKPCPPDSAVDGESQEYALKHAHEVLIADDMESHRLFGKYIFVAPKEEVFENFYRDYGSESLSANVDHVVNHGPFLVKLQTKAKDRHYHVFERLKIFLHDQDSTRRSGFDIMQWKNEGAFTVKYCKTLKISKSLQWKHQPDHSKPLLPICEEALAGIKRTTGNDTLWLKEQSKDSKNDWYDVAVALCRIIFITHKTHDTLLLMTILEADLEDLKRRGYDVDAIKRNFDRQAERADHPQPAPGDPQKLEDNHHSTKLLLAPLVNWAKGFKDIFKQKKNQPGEFVQNDMNEMVSEALKMCESDADQDRQQNQDKSTGGKKQRDVKYCGRRMDLDRCEKRTKNCMPVFKTRGSGDPPEGELEAFSNILEDLRDLFGLGPKKLHIFWQPDDTDLMGFNRSNAIYLNLGHYSTKHAHLSSDDSSRATMYAAWYFVIAHEIAHNKAFFHDEDHELLFSSIAQTRLIAFKKLLEEKAPNAAVITVNCHPVTNSENA
ncbi:hypothetical protein BS17DRAFT_879271 [Gyrodon lividus]|nr:hypothetical protein BS17DRAFT_879271 [Gyrodon lividus]